MHWYHIDPGDTEGFHDQNADTVLVPHGYWSLCLAENRSDWRLTLIEQNEALDEIIAEPYTGVFPTEVAAKRFAESCDAGGAIPEHRIVR